MEIQDVADKGSGRSDSKRGRKLVLKCYNHSDETNFLDWSKTYPNDWPSLEQDLTKKNTKSIEEYPKSRSESFI